MRTINLFSLLFLVLSCSTAPEFDRENVNDPDSEVFVPDFENLSAQINSDKTVTLNWNDQSNFETGYIISKSFGIEAPFVVIDSVSANITSYVDSSKELDVVTTYRVTAANSTVGNKKKLETRIYFGQISEVSTSSNGNQIEVLWNNEDVFSDSIRIEKRLTNTSGWEVISTVDRELTSFIFQDDAEAYSIDVRVSTILVNADGMNQVIDTEFVENQPFNLPSDLTAEFIDESTISVDWTDNSLFDEQFIIYQRPASTQNNAEAYIPIDTLDNAGNVQIDYYDGTAYDFNIKPLKNNSLGDFSKSVIVRLISTQPTISKVESVSESAAILHWIDNNIDRPDLNRYPTKNFVLEWAINGSSFEILTVLESNLTSYEVPNLNYENTYRFRIRSLSSMYDQVKIGLRPALIEELEFEYNDWDNPSKLEITPLGSHFVYEYSHSSGSYGLKMLNPVTGSTENHLFFDSDFRGFSFSSDEQLVAISSGSRPGVFDYQSSIVDPIYSYPEESMAIFIDNSSLILVDDSRLTLVDLETSVSTIVEEFEQFSQGYFQTYSDFPAILGSKVLLISNLGILSYDFEKDTTKLIREITPFQNITDTDTNGQFLITSNEMVELLDEDGLTLQAFYSNDLGMGNLDFRSAQFLAKNFVVIGTNQGIIALYNRTSGELLSFHQFSTLDGTSTLRTETTPFDVNNQQGTIMVTMRFLDGIGKILKLVNAWTTVL